MTIAGEKQKGQAKTARIPIKIVPVERLKKPDWIRVRLSQGPRFQDIKRILREQKIAYRVRGSLVPQYRRVFQQGHGDLYDFG